MFLALVKVQTIFYQNILEIKSCDFTCKADFSLHKKNSEKISLCINVSDSFKYFSFVVELKENSKLCMSKFVFLSGPEEMNLDLGVI